MDILGLNRRRHRIYNWYDSVTGGWSYDGSLSSRNIHITCSLKRWHFDSHQPFFPRQKDESDPSIVRELLHSTTTVLHMWLFCWFASKVTEQVSAFFRFASSDLSSNRLQTKCLQDPGFYFRFSYSPNIPRIRRHLLIAYLRIGP
jgi:hypothetical protein